MELKDTINLMTSEDYKERFIAEYKQLSIRCDKLEKFIKSIIKADFLGLSKPKHDCPIEMLVAQLNAMKFYKNVLEDRANIEEIDIGLKEKEAKDADIDKAKFIDFLINNVL